MEAGGITLYTHRFDGMICETQCNIGKKDRPSGMDRQSTKAPDQPANPCWRELERLRAEELVRRVGPMGMWTETQGEQRPSGENGWFLGPPRITVIGGQTTTPWAATCDGPSLTLDMAGDGQPGAPRTDPCCGRRLACWMSAPDGPLASFWLESTRQGRSQAVRRSVARERCG